MGIAAKGIAGHPDPRSLLDKSRVIFDREQVISAVDKMADEINAFYANEPIIVIAVMTGAIIPTAWLVTRLKMPVQIDFVHATRYQSGLYGAELEYRVPPRLSLEGKKVLIVDDILMKETRWPPSRARAKSARLNPCTWRYWCARCMIVACPGILPISSAWTCPMCTCSAVVWMPTRNGGICKRYLSWKNDENNWSDRWHRPG